MENRDMQRIKNRMLWSGRENLSKINKREMREIVKKSKVQTLVKTCNCFQHLQLSFCIIRTNESTFKRLTKKNKKTKSCLKTNKKRDTQERINPVLPCNNIMFTCAIYQPIKRQL